MKNRSLINNLCLHALWLPTSIAGRRPLFYRCSLDLRISILFSLPNLRGRLADRHQTLPRVRWWPRFIKFGRKFGWPLPPTEIWRCNNIKISAWFRTTSRLDREYLRNATRHHGQSENGFANYRHSRTGKLNLVYFGLQTEKIRTGLLTHPTGDRQAGHCHASS